jgi:glucosamine--fructose-6-phosphate aminotransferase (isomerizing)
MQGLQRLEYRGYDSAGVALVAPGMDEVAWRKKSGRLNNLEQDLSRHPMPEATAGIGHTRWATNGAPTDVNAHPHMSGDGRIAVIHNGIIENAPQLKFNLQAEGYTFASATDTEVAAKLLGKVANEVIAQEGKPDLFKALRRVARMLTGAFTILAVDSRQPDIVVGARHDSPLVVGLGDGENFLGSDVAAFVAYTKEALELGQDEAVCISADSVEVTDFEGNAVAEPKRFTVDWDASATEKGGWDSYMDKEIHEEPVAVSDTLLGRFSVDGDLNLDEVRIDEDVFRSIDKIVVIACGSASYAGLVAKYAIEHWVRIPVEIELAHEFRYRDPILTPRTLVVAISQSGETMDTLMALRHAREQGSRVLAICNTQGSTIPRESDAVLYTHAGPEIAVASTKAFVAQIVASYILGLYLAQVKGTMYRDEIRHIVDNLKAMPEKIQWVLDNQAETIAQTAEQMLDAHSFLFLGRHVGYPVAMEGALKLKEIAYTFSEGFAAGELKHGPIALVDEGEPVVVIVPSPRGRDVLHNKVISSIEEVKARGAFTIAVAEVGDPDVEHYADVIFWRPECSTLLSPLTDVVPLQLFAMDMAKLKHYDIDKPRNLAKSVTVE